MSSSDEVEEIDAGEGTDWGVWDERNDDEDASLGSYVSLVDGTEVQDIESLISHDRETYGINISTLADVYTRIKMINYLRKCSATFTDPHSGTRYPDITQFLEAMAGGKSRGLPPQAKLHDDHLLVPVLQDDVLLSWAPEQDRDEDGEDDAGDVDEEELLETLEGLEELDAETLKSLMTEN